jgi:hypothetical protein
VPTLPLAVGTFLEDNMTCAIYKRTHLRCKQQTRKMMLVVNGLVLCTTISPE